jgi:cell division protein FtsQ
MKKTGSKRGSGYDTGPGSAVRSAVLEAPEESLVPEAEMRWKGRGPAPAGALQRGYGNEVLDEPAAGYASFDEPEYVPRRGNLQARWRRFPRGILGRVVVGVVSVLVLGTIAVAAAGVHRFLMHDPRFVVGSSDDIQIEGARHLTRDQILSVFGADLERNIFRVSLPERKADLERLPWVDHATVMRLLPDTLRVKITERTPVAFVRQGTQIGLVDGSGVLLDMPQDAAGDPHYSFPVLTGLSANVPQETRAARIAVYEQFLHDLSGGGSQVTDSLSEVDVSDPEDVKALVASGSSDILVHFGSEDFLKRYQEFNQHLPEWRQQYPKLASADMRYEGQIVLEMQNGAGVTPGAAAAITASVAPPATVTAVPSVETPAMAKAEAPAKPSKLKLVAANATHGSMPAVLAGGARKPAASMTAPAKVVPARVVVKKAPVKKTIAGKKLAEGRSSANDKIFAELAAAHRAAMAKSSMAKKTSSGGVRGADGATR